MAPAERATKLNRSLWILCLKKKIVIPTSEIAAIMKVARRVEKNAIMLIRLTDSARFDHGLENLFLMREPPIENFVRERDGYAGSLPCFLQ